MRRRTALALLLVSAAAGCTAKAEIKTPPPPPPPPPPAPPPPPPPPPKEAYITISNRIEFETDSAVLLPQSLPILDEVVDKLNKNPHIAKIEIQGHTDNTGDDNKNLLLSESRAKSVRTYIVSKGIVEGRMAVRGFGEQAPVADNNTPEGREKNRRVEFRIVDQGATSP